MSSQRQLQPKDHREIVIREHREIIIRSAPMPPNSDSDNQDDYDEEMQVVQTETTQQLRSTAPSRYSTRDLSLPSKPATASTRDLTFTDATSTGHLSSQDRLAVYRATMGQKDGKKKPSLYTDSRAKTLVPLLALQSYHLPGNSWCQDWMQYMANNHPVFGICCHHPLHPIGSCTRVLALVGSVIFGLAMTNMFYLFFLWNPNFNQPVATLIATGGEWELTTGMLLLWTVGGGIHAGYNLVMWHIAACACCRAGGCLESVACCPSFGKHLIRVFLLISVLWAAAVVLLRIGISHNTTDGEADDSGKNLEISFGDDEWKLEVGQAQEFNFLVGYLVEMVLALFIYYPLGGTILFSGCLGCGCIPILGGRPAEVAAEKRNMKKRALQPNATSDESLATTSHAVPGAADTPMANEGGEIELLWTPQAVREFESGRELARTSNHGGGSRRSSSRK